MSDHADADLRAFDRIHEQCQHLRAELAKVIVGQEQIILHLLAALFSQGHVLMVGVPGLAKTLLVRTLARALDVTFRRIQFTPDLMPSDVLGTEILQEDPATGQRSVRFLPGPIFGQLILADEINRTPPKTQAALLEAMAERQVTVAGRSLALEEPFMVIATQNPIEQEGTYPLPEAALDRFMFSLWMDYPSVGEEERIVAESPQSSLSDVQRVFQRQELLETARMIQQMPASQYVVRYAVALSRASRPGDPTAPAMVRQYVQWGAGPRAGQYLLLGAKTLAALQGQATPHCQHIRQVAEAVLRHRLVLHYAAAGDGISVPQVIAELLAKVPKPEE